MGEPVRIGEVIADKYRITSVIGEGGMGVVLAADHLQLLQPVAIKFLHAGASPKTVERFAREARAAAQIPSEHVAKVMDIDFLATGEPYLVLERLEGEDLATLLRRSGPLPVHDVVEYLLQACEVVSQAHERGIIHRDLKPANLFLTRRSDGSACIKVLDFGISKLQHADPEESGGKALTATGAVMGSPVYMPPELWVSATRADARSDIWSLGVICYELLSGRLPFVGEGVAQICRAVLDAEPASLGTHRPELPAGLAEVVMKCLQKMPEQRHQTVAELVSALQPHAALLSAPRDQDGTPLVGAARTSNAAAMAATVASDSGGPEPPYGATAAASPEQSMHVASALTAPQETLQVSPVLQSPSVVAKPLRRLWLGLGAVALVAAIGVIVVVAYLTASKRGQSAKASRRRGADPAVTAAPASGDGSPSAGSRKRKTAAERWTPAFNHAPAIGKYCWRQLGRPKRVVGLAFSTEGAVFDAVSPKDPSQHIHCRVAYGITSLSEPMPLEKVQLAQAIPFRSLDLRLVRKLARDAQTRRPGAGKTQQIILMPLKGKLHWVVTVGADRKRVLYDIDGNHQANL